MNIKKILLIFICILLITGCGTKEKTDAIKFKEEYEKYNNTKIKLEISKNNIITYANKDQINKIIKEKTAVIFIGNPKDNLSRVAINILLKVADNSNLNTIYYIDSIDNINGIDTIENKKIPIVLNVLEGKIISYHNGTINDSTKLTEDEEIELYNKYLDGIKKVLQDSCDERC